MNPNGGMEVGDEIGRTYPEIIGFLNALEKYQSRSGGDANFGEKDTILKCFSNAGFSHIAYRKIKMKYTKEKLKSAKEHSHVMFESIAEVLLKKHLITGDEYFLTKQKLNTSYQISWSVGQVIAMNDPHPNPIYEILGDNFVYDDINNF